MPDEYRPRSDMGGRLSTLETLLENLVEKVDHMHSQLSGTNGVYVQMARNTDDIIRLKQMEAIVHATVMTTHQNAAAIQRLTEERGRQISWWHQLLLAVLVAIASSIATGVVRESSRQRDMMPRPYPHEHRGPFENQDVPLRPPAPHRQE